MKRAGFLSRIGYCGGSASAEFASTIVVFLLVALGIVETARAIQVYEQITNAAREGTRYAVVRGPNSPSPASSSDVQNYVLSKATGLDPNAMTVSVSWPTDASNPDLQDVVIDVTYPFSFSPHISLLPSASFNFSTESRMVIWPTPGATTPLTP